MSPPTKDTQLRNENISSDRHIDILLRNTASPSDRPWIENMAKDAERELEAYEAEINKLRSSLALLEHKRDVSKEKLFRCRSLLSPVHRLPPEILGDIFTILIDLPAKERWLSSKTHPALAVSRTCGRWRDIAIATPSVWSTVAICFNITSCVRLSYSQLHSLTRLFLDRSRRCPLKLVLDFDDRAPYRWDAQPHTISILKTLVQHSERWRTVELLYLKQSMIVHEVFAPIAGHLPILTDLTISSSNDWDDLAEDDDVYIDLFSDSPALTSISYEPSCPLTPQSPLPWRQIRSVRIKNAYYTEAIQIAPLWTNVEQLTFKQCGYRGRSTDHRDYLAIPSVTHLSLAARQEWEADFAFECFTLRQLSSLEISSIDGSWDVWDQRLLTDFLIRSACTITSLSLKRVPVTDEELIQLLRLMPMLKSLQLEEKSDDMPQSSFAKRTITRRFLQKLTIDGQDESPPFLPKLMDIGLVLYDDGLAERALPTALLSRWISNGGNGSKRSVDCIKSIDIVFIGEDKGPVEILETKLQPLRDARVWMSLRVAPMAVDEDDW
uniref:F-box domain-containing protein n=1 Tax=Moniliophthora roreri TaxID=221103 RepID=A0A0W0F760_MONRR